MRFNIIVDFLYKIPNIYSFFFYIFILGLFQQNSNKTYTNSIINTHNYNKNTKKQKSNYIPLTLHLAPLEILPREERVARFGLDCGSALEWRNW